MRLCVHALVEKDDFDRRTTSVNNLFKHHLHSKRKLVCLPSSFRRFFARFIRSVVLSFAPVVHVSEHIAGVHEIYFIGQQLHCK